MLTLLQSLGGATLALAAAYSFGVIAMRRKAAPPEILLATGAVIESLAVYLLLMAGLANRSAFIGMTVLAIAGALSIGRSRTDRIKDIPIAGTVLLALYGVWYLVNALAPEITPDGITYHLGLTREYARLGGFPDRIAFYDLIPQGMEMMYTAAFAFGRHPAAKLVEFAFFVAGVPLIFRLCARMGVSGANALVAAVLYFCAPVIGLTGSSSYNDAAGVTFLLAAIYLLAERRYFHAGLCAGFCYAIKMPGILIPALGFAWLVAQRRWRPAAGFALAASAGVLPWMGRAFALTGNPFAPLASAVFRNPFFHIATERELSAGLRDMHGISLWRAPWELAMGDGLAGTYGPLLLFLPVGLLALRRREGRLLWLGALLLAAPWITNTGARFLMQSVVLAGVALAMALPRPVAWAAVVLQAVVCLPPVLDRIGGKEQFRVHDFPVEAALGIEPESEYLKARLEEYAVARMIEKKTPPNTRILSLLNVANAYLDREVAVFWQSAEADVMLDTLRVAGMYTDAPALEWRPTWPQADVTALRFRMPRGYPGEWDMVDAQIFSGDTPVMNSPQWTFSGHPNRWEGPLAFDGNLATRWRTWEQVRPGMTFDVDFGHLQRITGAVVVTHTPAEAGPLETWGRDAKGAWRMLSAEAPAVPRAQQDLRLDAARALRKAGFRYLLVLTGAGGNAPLGNRMVGHEADWGMERAADAGRFFLLRVK